MSYQHAAKPLQPNAPCPCGRWQFRKLHLVSSPGFSAHEDYCPECKYRYLVVFKTTTSDSTFVIAVPLTGVNQDGLRWALEKIPDLPADVIARMLRVAQQLASPKH